MGDWNTRLTLYDQAVEACPRFERKGKSTAFTSANGYMFSYLNKAGELGIRLSTDLQEKFSEANEVKPFLSNGTVMRDYVLIPETMLDDVSAISSLLDQSYDHVMSLKPKPGKKAKK